MKICRIMINEDAVLSLLLVSLISFFAYFYNLTWSRPQGLRKKLQQQGINGPPPSFFYGNIPDIKRIQSDTAERKAQQHVDNSVSHDYMSYVLPHLGKWRKDYGPVFTFTLGNMIVLYMSDFDMVKDFCQCKSIEFGRSAYLRTSRGAILGHSIVTTKGNTWVHQRKIIAPAFFSDKVKSMTDMISESVLSLVERWEAKINEEAGGTSIRVDKDLKDFSAEVFSKACFGSFYAKGTEIFVRIVALQDLLSRQFAFLGLPGMRYIPFKSNREVWRLSRQIWNSVMELVKDQEGNESEDFLQVLVKNFNPKASPKSIVDNCKAMFFAGHETTATAAAFTLVLLASHPEWQKRVRDEVVKECAGQQAPNFEMLQKMKMLTMVIHETLRLYPASPFMSRETCEDMKFGDYLIPKGVNIWVPVAALHQDPANWGPDAGEFRPERFANGVSGACKQPHLYMAFGTGIRTCVGQNFAMIELKMLLSVVLSKFSFSLSPHYRHCIAYRLVSEPENGVHLQMQRV